MLKTAGLTLLAVAGGSSASGCSGSAHPRVSAGPAAERPSAEQGPIGCDLVIRLKTEEPRGHCELAPAPSSRMFEVSYADFERGSSGVISASVFLKEWEDSELSRELVRLQLFDNGKFTYYPWKAAPDRYVQGPHRVHWINNRLEIESPEIGAPDCRGCPTSADIPEGIREIVPTRIEALSAAVVGWPGAVVVRGGASDAQGSSSVELEAPLATILRLALPARGERPTSAAHFAGVRHFAWGQALVFAVTATGQSSGSDGCSSWTSQTRMQGELQLQASDGAFVALVVRGVRDDSESTCGASERPATSPPPSPCSETDETLEVGWAPCRHEVPV
jgi:hypothetical protein